MSMNLTMSTVRSPRPILPTCEEANLSFTNSARFDSPAAHGRTAMPRASAARSGARALTPRSCAIRATPSSRSRRWERSTTKTGPTTRRDISNLRSSGKSGTSYTRPRRRPSYHEVDLKMGSGHCHHVHFRSKVSRSRQRTHVASGP